MNKVGFPLNDPLYQRVLKASNAIQDLCVNLHYMSCESGVYRERGLAPTPLN